jgi:signal transduction histidine kinase
MDSPSPSVASNSALRAKSAGLAMSPESVLKHPLFRELSGLSGDIILLLADEGQRLIGANPQTSKALGYSNKMLRRYGALQMFADREAARRFFSAVWTGRPGVSERISCLHKSGRTIPALVRGHTLPESGNHLALVEIRLAAEEYGPRGQHSALSNLLRLPSASLASSPDLKRRVRSWLHRVCVAARLPIAHFHVLMEDAPGLPRSSHVWHVAPRKEFEAVRRHPDGVDFRPELHLRVVATRAPHTVPDLRSEPQFQAAALRALNLKSAFAVPVIVGDEVGAVSVFFSSQPLAQDSLLIAAVCLLARELGYAIHFRALSLKLTRIQDEERRRLASELHDTVAQSLSVLLLDLETAQQESALSPAAAAALDRAVTLGRQSLQEIRSFSYLLHPPIIDALGLLPSLRVFVEGFSRRSGLRIISELPDSLPRLPGDWEMAVFRVVQEGLINVQRHSPSATAEVRMAVSSGFLTLQIINEGASVPSLESGGLPSDKVGVGISGMRERLHAFGGEANLYSRAEKVILEAVVPLPRVRRTPQLPLKF